MKPEQEKLHTALAEIEEEFGGDISFIPKTSEQAVSALESALSWQLPGIFRYFYTQEANGLVIGEKRIYSIRDDSQKKTLAENLIRQNDPVTSSWFKGRPHIFQNYLVVGADGDICFCLSKKYTLDDPLIYLCEHPNSSKGVEFDRLDMNLSGLIAMMVENEFSA
jgi:hypothetical protein